MARYIIVSRPAGDYQSAFDVVDTEPGTSYGGFCPTVCSATDAEAARTIADALNGTFADQLEIAKRALREIHLFISDEKLDPGASGRWADYYTVQAEQDLVDGIQRDHEEPF